MKNNNLKKDPWGNLSCDAVRKLIEKEKTVELTSAEMYAVFEHCTICKECREINVKILEDLINGKDVN